MSDFGVIKNDYSFVCSECSHELSPQDFSLSVLEYGFIFLSGSNDVLIGIHCPECNKTAINRYDREYANELKEILFHKSLDNSKSIEPSFKYHSFPFVFDYHESIHGIHYFQKQILKNHIDSVTEPDFFVDEYFKNQSDNIENEPDALEIGFFDSIIDIKNKPDDLEIKSSIPDLKNTYCSYYWGDEAIGPVFAVYWFSEGNIESLVKLENDTGLRVFPRYTFYNPLFPLIETFCWEYHYKHDDVQELKKLFEVSALIPHSYVEIEKRRDFLKIISFAIEAFDTNYSVSIGKKVKELKSDGPYHKAKCNVLWERFCNNSVQEALTILSDKFIYDYIDQSQKIGFDLEQINKLRNEYFNKVYANIIPSNKVKSDLRRISSAEKKRVIEAEKSFSKVKIISEDARIGTIKIKLAQWANYKKNYEDIVMDFLLLGERGTGKELFAHAIGEAIGREVISINCGSIPDNLFESEFFGHVKGAFSDAIRNKQGFFTKADSGVLFMDEIGNLSVNNQKKLLRVLEDRQIRPIGSDSVDNVDVVIVFATNKNISDNNQGRDFELDLYDRINKYVFEIPPLKDRKGDIPLLVDYFLEQLDEVRKINCNLSPLKVSDELMSLLKAIDWPGNVRQLRNLIDVMIKTKPNKDRKEFGVNNIPVNFQNLFSKKIEPLLKKGNKKRPSDEDLIKHEMDGLMRKDVAEIYDADEATVSRWYRDIKKN
jgi:transcriptional regulator with PAS, ATPase and Fis domain